MAFKSKKEKAAYIAGISKGVKVARGKRTSRKRRYR